MRQEQVVGDWTETFDYHTHEVVGYLVGGELTLNEPDDEEKVLFEGDWSPVTYADLWSLIHNTVEGPQEVVFWEGFDRYTIYTPNPDDDCEFNVMVVQLLDAANEI